MTPTQPPTVEQWRQVQTRLDSVFNKVTPDRTLRYTGVATQGEPWTGDGRDIEKLPFRPSGDVDKVTVQAVYITC